MEKRVNTIAELFEKATQLWTMLEEDEKVQ
jgi:hypothetical protein